ncbi:MAG: DUF4268 domain-containing protein [Dehalococcoidia bacterium]|nr:DUF4268 domain-containing protein [Dehalococcoidia bacterium]
MERQNIKVSSLTPVELREVWRNEATDFTPWLVENLQALGAALGMELEVGQREAPVGSFSLDILASEVNTNRTVVIENQLEDTNHDHLGKVLTYAAGYNADVVVWLAKEFREEHRQTLDWLNSRTGTQTEFYGVVIELVKIDDSRPAYNFDVIAKPNYWRKSRVDDTSTRIPSERREAYQAFFQSLIDKLREEHRFTSARAAQPQGFYSFSSGFNGVKYGASFAQGGRARVDLYIDTGDLDRNKGIFDSLYSDKDAIEGQLKCALSWERLDERRASRVAVYSDGSIQDEEDHEAIRDWMIDYLLRFKKVFHAVLQAMPADML